MSENTVPQDKMCPKCGVNPATPPHRCPHEEIYHDDYDFRCTCCPACEMLCLMDNHESHRKKII